VVVRVVPEFAIIGRVGESVKENHEALLFKKFTLFSEKVGQIPVSSDPPGSVGSSLASEVCFDVFVEKGQFSSESFSANSFSKVSSVLGIHVDPVGRQFGVFGPD